MVASVMLARTAVPAGASIAAEAPQAARPVATLSNLTTLSRWAYPQTEALAHRSASRRSPVVGRLRFLTSDGQAAVYMELRSRTVSGHTWILVALPGRPNGATGWVPAVTLGEAHITHEYLRVDREALRATLYRDGGAIWSAPVGVGRPSLPTPAGHYYVTEKLMSIDSPLYGPLALGTSAYAPTLSEWPGGGVVGIHGTNEPGLIPGRPSHGCIRLRDADIEKLWTLIEVGTPIHIV